MSEEVRLIIWDLDETFWYGTLTEGGIRERPELSSLVKDLARRGIMSSICSKNDLDPVKKILDRQGLWEYFVFPSVNWEPKGPRVAAIVDAIQLRPATVMFIDDNPLNLEEVRRFVEGIQVRSHTFIPQIIAGEPPFKGKDDEALTRLKQYRLLQTRKNDEVAAGSDVSSFLRSSNIQVTFERDLESHIDRVIELINRTNQLNFTKVRLPEDVDAARAEISALLSRYNVQGALLRVSDRYGDHGFCGLYITNSEHNRLLHFCFSCRILGMGVEQWLYGLLGRPIIHVKGDVLSDVTDTSRKIDWINQVGAVELSQSRVDDYAPVPDRIIAHGGCDLSAVAHYFGVNKIEIIPEFNVMRNGRSLRTDHSVFLWYGLSGLSDAQREVARRLQYEDTDFCSELFTAACGKQCAVLSFATDAHYALYQHRETGLNLPYSLGSGPVWVDQRESEIPPGQNAELSLKIQQILRDEFDFQGRIGEANFKRNVRATFLAIAAEVPIFVLLPFDYHINKQNGTTHPDPSFVKVNSWTRDVAAEFANVELINIPDFVFENSEIDSILHFDRKVYFRIYEHLLKRLQDLMKSVLQESPTAACENRAFEEIMPA